MTLVIIYLQNGSLFMHAKQSRGRPKKVDERAVREAVLNQFWEKGYAGSSLSDLSASAGVSRPSLYELLGDKQAMYLSALETVGEQLGAAATALLPGEASIETELAQFFDAAIALYLSGTEPRGCLVMCTAPAEAASDVAIRAQFAMVIEQLDTAFEKRLATAQTAGEIPMAPPARKLARFATATLQSLALRARSGADTQMLKSMADDAIDLLTNSIQS